MWETENALAVGGTWGSTSGGAAASGSVSAGGDLGSKAPGDLGLWGHTSDSGSAEIDSAGAGAKVNSDNDVGLNLGPLGSINLGGFAHGAGGVDGTGGGVGGRIGGSADGNVLGHKFSASGSVGGMFDWLW